MNKEKWKIKSKKDRCLAFVFTALIIYGFSKYFTVRLDTLLMGITDARLTELNQPSGYGNVAVTLFIMGMITAAVSAAKKRSFKRILLPAAAGFLAFLVCIAAYVIHCELLIRVPQRFCPDFVWVSGSSLSDNGFSKDFSEEDEDMLRLVSLCASLQELPREEQKRLQEDFVYDYDREIHIWLRYPEKYFHSYSLIVRIQDNQIFILRNSGRRVTFFEDNGLLEEIEKIKN